MWPEQKRRPSTTTDLPIPRSRIFALDDDEDVRTQGQLPVFGSALQGPGIPIEDLADSSELLTKPELIAESPGAQDWDSNSIQLSSVRSADIDNPSHHLYREDYSSTSTSLPSYSPVPPTRTSGAKKVKVQQEFSQDIFADSMEISAPNQSAHLKRFRDAASSLAATALAPTHEKYGKAWGRFKNYCSENNFDPLSAEGSVVATWINSRAEETDSPKVLESDLESVKRFRLAVMAPIKNFYIAAAALEGCQKRMEAKSRIRLPIDPDTVYTLIRIALQENGYHSFVGIRQAAVYALKYHLNARFEEVRRLELRQIVVKETTLEVTFLKGKNLQNKLAQTVVIHPDAKGQTCPVFLIQTYLAHRVSLGHDGPNDFVFPVIGAKYQRVKPTYFVDIRVPVENMTYDTYRCMLKKHLDIKALRDLGVGCFPGDPLPPSLRREDSSTLADEGTSRHKSTTCKTIEPSVPHEEASLSKAWSTINLLLPTQGSSSQYSGKRKSLSRFPTKKFREDSPPKAEAPFERSNSETSLFSNGSSVQEGTSLQKNSEFSGQSSGSTEMDTGEPEVTQTLEASSLPISDLNFDALESLCSNWNTQVIFPSSWQKK